MVTHVRAEYSGFCDHELNQSLVGRVMQCKLTRQTHAVSRNSKCELFWAFSCRRFAPHKRRCAQALCKRECLGIVNCEGG